MQTSKVCFLLHMFVAIIYKYFQCFFFLQRVGIVKLQRCFILMLSQCWNIPHAVQVIVESNILKTHLAFKKNGLAVASSYYIVQSKSKFEKIVKCCGSILSQTSIFLSRNKFSVQCMYTCKASSQHEQLCIYIHHLYCDILALYSSAF